MFGLALGQEGWLYRLFLLLHIICAIVGFGAVIFNGLYAVQSQQRPGPAGRAISEANFAVSMIAEKFIYAVPVFGIALVLSSNHQFAFRNTWVWLSLVLYVVALGVSHTIVLPGARRINSLLLDMEHADAQAVPPPQAAQVQAIGKKLGGASAVLHLMLVAMLVLMIWKPGS